MRFRSFRPPNFFLVMPAPLSLDLRQRILAALEAGGSQGRVAERFQVSKSTVERLVRRVKLTGSPAPKPHAGGPVLLIVEVDRARVLEWVRTDPDLTQEEIARRFGALGRPVSQPTVSRALARFDITRKKRR